MSTTGASPSPRQRYSAAARLATTTMTTSRRARFTPLLHPELVREEGPAVGPLLDLHRGRLARAVAGARVDADQDRVLARLRGLERGGELVAVRRHDAVVVVRGRDERGGVARAGMDVVEWRVRAQRLELRRVGGGAGVARPGP